MASQPAQGSGGLWTPERRKISKGPRRNAAAGAQTAANFALGPPPAQRCPTDQRRRQCDPHASASSLSTPIGADMWALVAADRKTHAFPPSAPHPVRGPSPQHRCNPTRGTLSQVSCVRPTGYLHGGEPERCSGDNVQCPRATAVSGETSRGSWVREEPGPSSPFPPLPPPPRPWPQAVRPHTCTHSPSTQRHLGTGRAA